MATIYDIKIKTVSPFYNYSTDDVKEIFEIFLKEYKHKKSGLTFESTEVIVEKK